jgi:hypothetical protein
MTFNIMDRPAASILNFIGIAIRFFDKKNDSRPSHRHDKSSDKEYYFCNTTT